MQIHTERERLLLLSLYEDLSGQKGSLAHFFANIRSKIHQNVAYDVGMGIVNIRTEKKDDTPQGEGSFSLSSALHYSPIKNAVFTAQSRVDLIDGLSAEFHFSFSF